MGLKRATVITVSDGVSAGTRQDSSGEALASMLEQAGFDVGRVLVTDDARPIADAIVAAASASDLVLTTGGTGFGPRDVTPEATSSVLARHAPGLIHLMLARGLESTTMAALTRATAGTVGSALVINLPGSPRGATESLQALSEVIPHALQLLAGENGHH